MSSARLFQWTDRTRLGRDEVDVDCADRAGHTGPVCQESRCRSRAERRLRLARSPSHEIGEGPRLMGCAAPFSAWPTCQGRGRAGAAQYGAIPCLPHRHRMLDEPIGNLAPQTGNTMHDTKSDVHRMILLVHRPSPMGHPLRPDPLPSSVGAPASPTHGLEREINLGRGLHRLIGLIL